MHRAGECKSLLNTRWTRRRLGHRCKIDSDGKRCCSSRSACVYSITQLLVSLFLACLPPIPALNKWVANYPVLTWLVLGTMMHHILPRMWDLTVFKIPNIFQEGGVGGDDPDVEGEGIQSHKKKRAKRVNRLRDYFYSDVRQLYAATCLLVTWPFRDLLADYLQEECMYAKERRRQDHGVWLPWDGATGTKNRPTLLIFMENDQEPLRRLQAEVAKLLLGPGGNRKCWMLHYACAVVLLIFVLSRACLVEFSNSFHSFDPR